MGSRDLPPSLPPRGSSSRRTDSTDMLSRATNPNVTYIRYGTTNHSSYNNNNTTTEATPPKPPRDGTNGIRKNSFETKSFVHRHTAKAFSEPDQYHSRGGAAARRPSQSDEQLPPAPPKSLPPSNRPVSRSNTDASDTPPPIVSRQRSQHSPADTAPPPPVNRPPSRQFQNNTSPSTVTHPKNLPRSKSTADPSSPPPVPASIPHSKSQPRMSNTQEYPPVVPTRLKPQEVDNSDLERRFCFHDPSDFPPPDMMETSITRSYPSIKRRHANNTNGIGCL